MKRVSVFFGALCAVAFAALSLCGCDNASKKAPEVAVMGCVIGKDIPKDVERGLKRNKKTRLFEGVIRDRKMFKGKWSLKIGVDNSLSVVTSVVAEFRGNDYADKWDYLVRALTEVHGNAAAKKQIELYGDDAELLVWRYVSGDPQFSDVVLIAIKSEKGEVDFAAGKTDDERMQRFLVLMEE